MISDKEFLQARACGDIVIEPYDPSCLGSNSYDIHLSKHLAVYKDEVLDAAKDNEIVHFDIPEEGYVLEPGEFYLGSTLEYTETTGYVPVVDGKSSTGRLSMFIHVTAGKGDPGFRNHWTLEIMVQKKVRVYAGMPVGQIIYHRLGEVIVPYDKKASAKYTERDPRPVRSMMFKNFPIKSVK